MDAEPEPKPNSKPLIKEGGTRVHTNGRRGQGCHTTKLPFICGLGVGHSFVSVSLLIVFLGFILLFSSFEVKT